MNLFDVLFSENGKGNIFVDIAGREVLIEKNFFANTLKSLIAEDGRQNFKNDLLAPKSIEIYDTNKINTFLDNLDTNGFFLRFGAQKKKIFHKILLSSMNKKEEYRVGWFVKSNFSAHESIGFFLKNHSFGSRVEIITNLPKEIESRIAGLKNITITY